MNTVNVDRIQIFYSTVSAYFMSCSKFGSRQSSPLTGQTGLVV